MGSDFFETTIGDQITLQRGFDITKKQQLPGTIPVVSSGGISSFHSEAKVESPGVVLGRKGTLGTVFYLDQAYWPHDTSLWVKDFKGNNPRFVYYFFKNFTDIIKKMDVGAANPTLNRNHVHILSTEWPKRSIQDRIDKALSVLDKKIELNRQTNQTLEQMAQALFKSWFVDFDSVIDNALAAGNPIPDELQERAERRQQQLAKPDHKPLSDDIRQLFPSEFELTEELGWVPKGWRISSFGAVSQCFDRNRIPLSKKQREGKKPGFIPYHGATSVMDYINEWTFDGIFLLIGEDGSVIKEDGSPFVQYIWGKTWVNNHAHVLQGKNGLSTEHLMVFMRAQNINAYITGAVQLKINQGNMNSIPFLMACDDINQHFSNYITPLYSKFRQLSESNNALTKLRDTLLPKLISGELRLPSEATEQQPVDATS